jgi:2',3'-cyclic-nucleotide 2'-phosphodiesterase (5'-nucleotidase family)
MSKHYFKILVFSLYFLGCKDYIPQDIQSNIIPVNVSNEKLDSTFISIYMPYKVELDSMMRKKICFLKTDLTKKQPESELGNMVADILFYSAQKNYNSSIDFAITNIGGIRINSLNKGTLYLEDAYKIMPFDNTIVIQEIEGKTLKILLDYIASKGGWPVSNLKFKIINQKAENIYINGKLFDIEKKYLMATNDYIANGGDYCDMLKEIKQIHTNILLRDAIVDYWKTIDQKNDSLYFEIEGRIQNE